MESCTCDIGARAEILLSLKALRFAGKRVKWLPQFERIPWVILATLGPRCDDLLVASVYPRGYISVDWKWLDAGPVLNRHRPNTGQRKAQPQA